MWTIIFGWISARKQKLMVKQMQKNKCFQMWIGYLTPSTRQYVRRCLHSQFCKKYTAVALEAVWRDKKCVVILCKGNVNLKENQHIPNILIIYGNFYIFQQHGVNCQTWKLTRKKAYDRLYKLDKPVFWFVYCGKILIIPLFWIYIPQTWNKFWPF